MKVKEITQTPFGTLISLDEQVPSNIVGNLVTFDDMKYYIVRGIPSDIWTEILIDKTSEVSIGQIPKFLSDKS